MNFDLITIFPDYFQGLLAYGVVARARQTGLVEIRTHNLRDYAHDPHHTTDDRPFGGGEGMVMKPEPIRECLTDLLGDGALVGPNRPPTTRVILLSAQGRVFSESQARQYSQLQRMVLICGRYEGVDERIAQYCADDEVSVGDFVLSGGEPAAALVLDAVARLVPGVLGHADSAVRESFASHETVGGALDCPHYTRPVEYCGWTVPAVLREGNHAAIRRWRRQQALRKTQRNRPDLFSKLPLSAEDRELLEE